MDPVTFIPARRAGRCPQCRCSIEPGDLIGKAGRQRWLCGDCALEPLRPYIASQEDRSLSRTTVHVEREITTDRRMRNAAGLAPLFYVVLEHEHGPQTWLAFDETLDEPHDVLGLDLAVGRVIATLHPGEDGSYRYTETIADPDTAPTTN